MIQVYTVVQFCQGHFLATTAVHVHYTQQHVASDCKPEIRKILHAFYDSLESTMDSRQGRVSLNAGMYTSLQRYPDQHQHIHQYVEVGL